MGAFSGVRRLMFLTWHPPYTDCTPLRCAFTTRHAGTSGRALNLSVDLGQRAEVLANRQRVLDALGLAHSTLSTIRQVHGNHVCVVDAHVVQHGLRGVEGDALVTALPGDTAWGSGGGLSADYALHVATASGGDGACRAHGNLSSGG